MLAFLFLPPPPSSRAEFRVLDGCVFSRRYYGRRSSAFYIQSGACNSYLLIRSPPFYILHYYPGHYLLLAMVIAVFFNQSWTMREELFIDGARSLSIRTDSFQFTFHRRENGSPWGGGATRTYEADQSKAPLHNGPEETPFSRTESQGGRLTNSRGWRRYIC